MLLNDFRVQLATAYPDLEPFRSGRHLKFRGRIKTDDGDKRAYIKILNIGDVAKEALCAVLARKLHLPVPQPFYVQVDPSYTEMGAGGIAFATEEELVPFPRIVDFEFLERELLKWSEVNKCATFDAWIANRDRLPKNVLYEGESSFWMIDHDDALPSYLTESSPVSTQLIELIKREKSEHELYQTREHMMEFANKFLTIDWGEIKGLVRLEELPGSERYFGSYITFLKKRAEYMREILNAELGIKQLSINFEEEKEKTEQEKNR